MKIDPNKQDIPKLEPSPVKNATLELRFTSSEPFEAMFVGIYNALADLFNGKIYEPLGAKNIPLEIREKNPALKYAPDYQVKWDNYVFRIGPNVICITNEECYNGWIEFSSVIERIITIALPHFKTIERVGLRYISFFEDKNIFDNAYVKISISDESILGQTLYNSLGHQFEYDGFLCLVQLNNNSILATDGQNKSGSLVDVDISQINIASDKVLSLIPNAHTVEKLVVANILTTEFIDSLIRDYGVK